MSDKKPRVLSVGQCSPDHYGICRLLGEAFGAEVAAADQAEEALAAAKAGDFDLVLVNRVFDATGESGLELIRRLRADADTSCTPVMLVSNYEDAQAEAAALGARPGFGKAELGDSATQERLAQALRTVE